MNTSARKEIGASPRMDGAVVSCVLVCLVCAGLALFFKKIGKPTGAVAVH